MAEPRLITYNGKQYDLDVLRDTVLNNYDTYARLFGYGNNKFKKDYIGLTLILRELENGNAGIETGRIVFNDNFGYDKGDFGKPRNKSKHYTNPAWMILDTVLKMEAYNPDAKKKKLSKSSLNQELTSEIGDVSNLTPLYRIQAQKDAVNKLLNKYANIGENYILDEGFDINEYLNNLRTLQKYLDTEGLDDDNYIFHRLGITNVNTPEEVKPTESKLQKIIKDLMDAGYTEAEAKLEGEKLFVDYKKKFLEDYRKSLGVDTLSGTNGSTSSGSGNSASNTSGNNTGNNPGTDSLKKDDTKKDDTKKDELPEPPETPRSKFVKWIQTNNINEGDYWSDSEKHKSYKLVNGVARELSTYNRKYRQISGMPIGRNGMKLGYIKNIKKYQDPNSPLQVAYDEAKRNGPAFLSALQIIPGPIGRFARIAYPLVDAGITINDLNNGDISKGNATTNLIQDGVNLTFGVKSAKGTRNTSGRQEYSRKVEAHKSKYNPEAEAQSKLIAEDLKQREQALNLRLESAEYKAIVEKEQSAASKGRTARLKKTEKDLKNDIEREKAEIEQYKTDNLELLKYNENLAASRTELENTRNRIVESEKNNQWTPSTGLLTGGLGINVGAGLYNDYILGNELHFNDYMRMASPLASRYNIGLNDIKNGWNYIFKNDLPTVEKALGESAEGAKKAGWFRRLFSGKDASAPMIIGPAIAAAATQNGLAQGMGDLYSMRAGEPITTVDPVTGMPSTTGMLKGFTNIGGTIYGLNQYGFPISSSLQNVTAYGNAPDWMKQLGVVTDEEGRSVIPALNAERIMSNPELYSLAVMHNIPFSNVGYVPLNMTGPEENSINRTINNYLAGVRGAGRGETTDLKYVLPYLVGASATVAGGNAALSNPLVRTGLSNMWKGFTNPYWLAMESLAAGLGIKRLNE